MALTTVLLVLALAVLSKSQTNINRVCYYVPDSALTPDLLDPILCTHIIVGFGTVVNGTLKPAKPTDIKIYEQLNDLKRCSPRLKTLLSIGGGAGAGGFPETVRNDTARLKFVTQSLAFLHKYGFDGLDVDWEFPAWNGDPPEDKKLFTQFLKEFNEASSKQRTKKLLTAAVAAVLPIIDISYEVAEMAKYVDFINLMCYDYHYFRKYFPFTGHNSPLFKHPNDVVYLDTLNTAWSAQRWNASGMPKSKIMIGIPTYGHTFKLLQEDENGVNAPTVGPGSGSGWITYTEICKMLKLKEVKSVFDNESMVPYAYEGLNWASYEDVTSITYKGNWIVEQGYGGAMTWNLNSDDWSGCCDPYVKFPLHLALRKATTTPKENIKYLKFQEEYKRCKKHHML